MGLALTKRETAIGVPPLRLRKLGSSDRRASLCMLCEVFHVPWTKGTATAWGRLRTTRTFGHWGFAGM